jgi:hypothetical protein
VWHLRLVGSLLSAALLLALLAGQDWRAIGAVMAALPLWALVAGMILLVLRHFWNTLRWLILVRAQGIALAYGQGLRLVFAGLFASNFLPGMVGGDVIRMTGLVARSPRRVAAAASVVVDRAVGVMAMSLFLPFGIPLLRALLASGASLGATALLLTERFWAPLRRGTEQLLRALRLWLGQPIALAAALAAALMAIVTFLTGVWALAVGLGIPVGFAEVAGVSVLTYFFTLVPLSINGYGLRELAVLTLYVQVGATPEQATALALLTRAIFLLTSLPGALWVGEMLPADWRRRVRDEEPL